MRIRPPGALHDWIHTLNIFPQYQRVGLATHTSPIYESFPFFWARIYIQEWFGNYPGDLPLRHWNLFDCHFRFIPPCGRMRCGPWTLTPWTAGSWSATAGPSSPDERDFPSLVLYASHFVAVAPPIPNPNFPSVASIPTYLRHCGFFFCKLVNHHPFRFCFSLSNSPLRYKVKT